MEIGNNYSKLNEQGKTLSTVATLLCEKISGSPDKGGNIVWKKKINLLPSHIKLGIGDKVNQLNNFRRQLDPLITD